MQNPEQEIASVALLLTASDSPDIQKAAFLKYVAPDVGFKHPLCYVPPSRDSRATLLGIYQWYRVLSPKIIGRVHSVVYDEPNHTLLLDISQQFHIRISPLKPAWSRLLVRITIKEINELYYISFQEDFYHADDFARLLVPALAPAILLVQAGTSVASNVYASIAQMLGFWRPSHKAGVADAGLYDGDKTD
ncbi:hypothetical protein F5878DRAFT_432578 [Lentinula raphanica]|uniref:SigF-like NTF2-like domain-containing protein n=1 Tax=Lentinula raphanica TaxID=153919 RepID=A0AA38PFF8_9AGAR|nr:hypothetical protein F5880DRAFT_631994 [Lentinula raphanica]KAJ3841942.1 hypothetical protein F5878DRAFT_432578 [Lentinula raphanica]